MKHAGRKALLFYLAFVSCLPPLALRAAVREIEATA